MRTVSPDPTQSSFLISFFEYVSSSLISPLFSDLSSRWAQIQNDIAAQYDLFERICRTFLAGGFIVCFLTDFERLYAHLGQNSVVFSDAQRMLREVFEDYGRELYLRFTDPQMATFVNPPGARELYGRGFSDQHHIQCHPTQIC